MPGAAHRNYEVIFCVPGEAVDAKGPHWFIEGFYADIEAAQRAARALLAATRDRLEMVSIVHAEFDAARGAFRERVVWTKGRGLALLSRLNLLPLEAETRARIVAHFDRSLATPPNSDGAIVDPFPIDAPSPVLVGLAGMTAAAICALGVLVVLT